MKEMNKARILTKRSVKSVMNERQILTFLNSPFLVNMYYAFQDRENLYLVMDLLTGGDLRYHICKYRKFDEETTSKYSILPCSFFFELIFKLKLFYRVLGRMFGSRTRDLPRKEYHSQRYQARKLGHRRDWLP